MTFPGTHRAAKRPAAAPAATDESSIALLVEEFYKRVRRDPLLNPVCERAVGRTDADWAGHLALLRDFWSSIMLTSGRYNGNPQVAHLSLPDLKPAMVDCWLTLFRSTSADVLEPDIANAFAQRAERIGQSLRGLECRSAATQEGPDR